MPRTTKALTINFKNGAERAKIEAEIEKTGLSESNWGRTRIGLEPLQHGGARIKAEEKLKPPRKSRKQSA